MGSKPGGAGDGIQVFGGSKPGTGGSTLRQGTNTGIELFGTGYKPGTTGGQKATDGVELFGSKVSTASGDN